MLYSFGNYDIFQIYELGDQILLSRRFVELCEEKGLPEPQAASKPSTYAYYVVMGVFSTEENAQRAIEQAESRIKDLNCRVLPFKDKFMVTLFGSDKIGDCNSFANSYRDIYADLWVYRKK